MTVPQLIYLCYRDIEVVYPGQTPSSDEQNDALDTLHEIFGSWSQEGLVVPTHTLTSFDLTAAQPNYTMGVGGNWDTTAGGLPIKIKGAVSSLAKFQKKVTILAMGDFEKVVENGTGRTDTLPTILGVDNAAPLRNIRLFPTPNDSAAVIEVSYWTPLSQWLVPLTLLVPITNAPTPLSFPLPGFEQALRNELTNRLAVMFKRPVDQTMMGNAAASKSALTRIDPGEVTDAPAPPAPQPAP